MYDRLKVSIKGTNEEDSNGTPRASGENALINEVMTTLSNEMRSKVQRFARLDSGPSDDDAEYADQSGRPLSDESRSALLKAEVVKVLAAAFTEASAETIDEIVNKGFENDSTVLDGSDPGRPGFVERAAVATIVNAVNAYHSEGGQSKGAKFLSSYRTMGNVEGRAAIEVLVRSKPARLAQSEEYLAWLFARAAQPESIQCPEDAPVRRGFQVLGPEGWRTFNQDERLMVAMSSSAEPLISTLKDVSNRVIRARDNPSAELLSADSPRRSRWAFNASPEN